MRGKFSLILFIFFSLNLSAEDFKSSAFLPKKKFSLITDKKGIYFSYERGIMDVFAFGGEWQHKKLAIKETHAHAFSGGINYNYRSNILGFDAGYWHREGAIGLTYGGEISFFTNHKNQNFVLTPELGFRFSGFHLQAGYKWHFIKENVHSNTFFIRLRFTLINDVNRKLRKD